MKAPSTAGRKKVSISHSINFNQNNDNNRR
jgi:hypothetical protein